MLGVVKSRNGFGAERPSPALCGAIQLYRLLTTNGHVKLDKGTNVPFEPHTETFNGGKMAEPPATADTRYQSGLGGIANKANR